MKMNKLTFIFISLLILTACRKDELPVPTPDLGGLTSASVELSPNYENQIYFDLSSNSNKGLNSKTDWDLRFSCDPLSSYILLNTSKVMLASQVISGTFEDIVNTSGFNNNVRAEHPSGRLDSIAIRSGNLFILDRGYDANGAHLGHFKMEILEHNNTHFKGRFANINGSNEQTITLSKDNTYNFVYMKWNPSSTITTPTIEPAKEEWDLFFTQYTEIFYEPEFMPYSVVGCLTNTYNTLACRVTNKTFEEINLEYAESLVLSNDRDVIGYNWKTFLYEQNIYAIHSEKVYVIKDNEGFFYKLRFIDFYNHIGEKGTPTFEYQRL